MAMILSLSLVGIMGTGGAVDVLYDSLMAIVDAMTGTDPGSGSGS